MGARRIFLGMGKIADLELSSPSGVHKRSSDKCLGAKTEADDCFENNSSEIRILNTLAY